MIQMNKAQTDDTYIQWKHWDEIKFATICPIERFYFEQIFSNKVSNNSRILEIGFGNGTLLSYFRGLGHTVVGTELNDTLVASAITAGYTAYKGAVWEINELQSDSFDLIVGLDVAEHMTYEELLKLFSWISTHLNKSGMLCLKFPEGGSPFGLSNQNGDFTHISTLTQSKILAICLVTKLELLSYQDDILSSNKLCPLGILGKFILLMLQFYANGLKWLMKLIFYPISPSLKFCANSIAFISLKKLDGIKKKEE